MGLLSHDMKGMDDVSNLPVTFGNLLLSADQVLFIESTGKDIISGLLEAEC